MILPYSSFCAMVVWATRWCRARVSRCHRRCKKSSQVAFEYGSGDAMCKGWVYMNFECCGGARKSEEKVVGFRPSVVSVS